MLEFPRFPLAQLPTPLHLLSRLQQRWQCGPLWTKRDDLTGFGVSGNKARPLEYLVGDALRGGSDTLIAVGAAKSNFCAAAALAAQVSGLTCEIIRPGPPPVAPPPAAEIARALGAVELFRPDSDRADLDVESERRAAELAAQGRRPYAMPRGGATAIGALGFAVAAAEILTQCAAADIRRATVVMPVGSGGSMAGLIAGLSAVRAGLFPELTTTTAEADPAGRPGVSPSADSVRLRVIGASVSRPAAAIRQTVATLAGRCARLIGAPEPALAEVDIRDMIGPGFGLVDDAEQAVITEAMRTEGLLLDGSYGGKTLLLARQLARAGHMDEPIIYWATGGLPDALSALRAGAHTDHGRSTP